MPKRIKRIGQERQPSKLVGLSTISAVELPLTSSAPIALPYKWRQELGDVDITVPVPQGTRGRDLDVKITKTRIHVGLKGKEKIMDDELCKSIKVEESTWTLGSLSSWPELGPAR